MGAGGIDAIFAGAKDKAARKAAKAAKRAAEANAAAAAKEAHVAALTAEGAAANRTRGADSPTPLRFDEELGVNVYSVAALGVGRGGGTDACPFDCQCCF